MGVDDLKLFLQQEIENLIFTKVDFDDSLLQSKLLDSISVVDLAVAIEEKTGIHISGNDITEKNFDSINKIIVFINENVK